MYECRQEWPNEWLDEVGNKILGTEDQGAGSGSRASGIKDRGPGIEDRLMGNVGVNVDKDACFGVRPLSSPPGGQSMHKRRVLLLPPSSDCFSRLWM